jgi:hypothetical protein
VGVTASDYEVVEGDVVTLTFRDGKVIASDYDVIEGTTVRLEFVQ